MTKTATKTKAIVPAQPTMALRIGAVNETFKELAKVLSGQVVAPAKLAKVFDTVDTWAKVLDDLKAAAKMRIAEMVNAEGEAVTEKGTKRLERDGVLFGVKPHRTGTDPKKLEALLRAKKMDPSIHMATVVSYKVDEGKLGFLIHSKELTEAEVESCAFETTWVVEKPRLLETDDE